MPRTISVTGPVVFPYSLKNSVDLLSWNIATDLRSGIHNQPLFWNETIFTLSDFNAQNTEYLMGNSVLTLK